MNEKDKSDRVENQVGRFVVSRAVSSPPPDIISPRSIFDSSDDGEARTRRKSFYRQSDSVDKIKSFDDNKTTLTLYEDDLCDKIEEIKSTTEGETPKANLGTLFGVFLPCCQNIVGVIYFVRFPWIVGCAGLLEGLAIVGLCCLVSITVAISISAIATNGKVTGGGTYFMISRSLGPAFGGSVGFLFFMGTSISVAMYFIGTVETLLNSIAPGMTIFGGDDISEKRLNDYRVYGTALLLMMTIIVFIGVTCVQRFGMFAILFLIAAILSTLIGLFSATEEDSIKVCLMGDRLFDYHFVHYNGSWQCNKNKDGKIYKAYCSANGTCDDFYNNNDPKLIAAIPGLRLRLLRDNLYSTYTTLDKIPGTDIDAVNERDIVSDLTTSFVILMGIYFPSITGVESGSNYSGDLKDAHRSIPLGTMSAVTVTSILYMGTVVLFSGAVDGHVLRDKYGNSLSESGELMLSMMAWPSKWVVLVGTLTATVGAGLQALAGGPRLLLAIADDGIFPFLSCFARTWRGEPTLCLLLSFIIALCGILISRLDYVAPIVTMFFLMCYGFINFAVTLQSLLDLPSWRPSFKFYHWSVTLMGSALCIAIMFMSSWIYAIVAIFIAICLYHYIEFKGAQKDWGDGITGLAMSAAIYALRKLKQDYYHIKNWRPQMLVLLKPNENETYEFGEDNKSLIHLSLMLQMGRGLTLYGSVIQGKLEEHEEEIKKYKQLCRLKLDALGAKGFVDMAVAPNVSDALSCMMQCAGLGPLHPNTVIIGWPTDWINQRNILAYHIFLESMKNIESCSNAAIVLKANSFPAPSDRIFGTIDLWWVINDGGMLLLLAHLFRRTKTWARCKLRVFTVADATDNTAQIEKDLNKYLYDLRMNCAVEVVEMKTGDITPYVYERTLKLEERTRMMTMLAKHKREKEAQNVLEKARSFQDMKKIPVEEKKIPVEEKRKKIPSEHNVRHMNTALQLNKLLTEKSSNASMIILNLPFVPATSAGQADYMSFLEVLTEKLETVLLVRGTGSEVITIFN